ncbi:Bacterial regulatory protein, tetR family [Rosistilla carotiformis]|uniref:Bacterial regulatory protein, tetR family n=1 Tax=Rosistilla carotiformis TaxID=2528017 RepID=A0A518JXV4_9BACT|nr:TetR/AcrR family transcriptional regulator [Rosistilla carotiformis]QDV70377.1 Bacterial regulatory protein, tetR family [Rosistilla carotiformis]
MQTLTPKQREIRQRETRILDLARPMVASGGISLLSMDAIAAELKTAKGTVYNHFPNKEEIVLALAIQAVECRLGLFNRAAMMRGCPRERVAAIGIACELFADRFNELFRIEQIIRHDAVWDKTSPKRQDLLRNCESRCMHTVAGVVRDAMACGDLENRATHAVEDLVFGLWSLVYGGLMLEMTSPSLADLGIENARRAIRRNCNGLLDGLQWQPLFEPKAYERWIKKVRTDLNRWLDDAQERGDQ